MNKAEIRSQFLAIRNGMSSQEVNQKSEVILSRLKDLEVFQSAQTLLFYMSVKNEVQTQSFLKKWVGRKAIYLPKLISDSQFKPLLCSDFSSMQPNPFGILEPQEDSDQKDISLDLIIVPGVGFDEAGNRVGMGKGYYDRFLAHYKSVKKIGLAYEKQILDQIPNDLYDVAVDVVITEDRIIDCLSHRF